MTTPEQKSELEKLKEREKQIQARIAAIEAKANTEKRKIETRLKVLVGAGVLADIDHASKENESQGQKRKAELVTLLNRAIQNKKDRDFLTAQGWLTAAAQSSKPEPDTAKSAGAENENQKAENE